MLRRYKFIKLYFLLICVFFINTSVCASLYLPKNNQILRSKKGSIDDIEQDAFNYQIKTIVIDAGHGGHDTGAKGSFSLEKDNSLAIALKVGRLIKSNYPNIRVIYTRTTDVFIPLMERAAIANRNKADLFMSIHCNSTRLKKIKVVKKVNKKSIHTTKWVGDSSIFGTETYVLGLHRTKDNLEVASRENQVILLEEDKGKKYEKFDIDTPEGAIMYSLMASQNLEKVYSFASQVRRQFYGWWQT
ncbi:MAG: N-acetylmuramoyl-L-alanine amidase family protein [Solitalea-like symbiont of Acarus siro]